MTHQLLFLCPHEEIDIFFEVVVASLGEPPFELVPEAFNAVGMQVLVGGVNIMFTMIEPPVMQRGVAVSEDGVLQQRLFLFAIGAAEVVVHPLRLVGVGAGGKGAGAAGSNFRKDPHLLKELDGRGHAGHRQGQQGEVCYKQAHVWCPCTPANKTQLTLNYTYLYEMMEIHHMMGTNQMMVVHHRIKMMVYHHPLK